MGTGKIEDVGDCIAPNCNIAGEARGSGKGLLVFCNMKIRFPDTQNAPRKCTPLRRGNSCLCRPHLVGNVTVVQQYGQTAGMTVPMPVK